jgi:hypothetical protein
MTTKKTNNNTKISVSSETRTIIFKDIEQSYKDDVQETIKGRKCWRQVGLTFETMSKVTVAIGCVLSFSSGYFDSNILSFVSGSVSVISLALLQFGSFSFKQGKKRANDLNMLLSKLNLDTVPVFEESLDNGSGLSNDEVQKRRKKNLSSANIEATPETTIDVSPENIHVSHHEIDMNNSIKNIKITENKENNEGIQSDVRKHTLFSLHTIDV